MAATVTAARIRDVTTELKTWTTGAAENLKEDNGIQRINGGLETRPVSSFRYVFFSFYFPSYLTVIFYR